MKCIKTQLLAEHGCVACVHLRFLGMITANTTWEAADIRTFSHTTNPSGWTLTTKPLLLGKVKMRSRVYSVFRFRLSIFQSGSWLHCVSTEESVGRDTLKSPIWVLLHLSLFLPHMSTIMTQETEHCKTKYDHIHVNSRKHPSLGGFSLCNPPVSMYIE